MQYLIQISSTGTAPVLTHPFTMASDTMARDYARKASLQIYSPTYTQFTLFRTEADDQAHICDWTVETLHSIIEEPR